MQQLEKTLVVSLENEMTDFTAAHELLRPVGQGAFEAGFIGELVYERGSQGVDYGFTTFAFAECLAFLCWWYPDFSLEN